MTPVVNVIGQLPMIGLALGIAPGSALAEGEGEGLALSEGWQSAVARSSSEMLPSIWANLTTSAFCGVTARITICCWPLSVVVLASSAWAGGWLSAPWSAGGSSVPRTWTPWMSVLTVVEL